MRPTETYRYRQIGYWVEHRTGVRLHRVWAYITDQRLLLVADAKDLMSAIL